MPIWLKASTLKSHHLAAASLQARNSNTPTRTPSPLPFRHVSSGLFFLCAAPFQRINFTL
jgi:hypothetical protein